MTDRKGLAPLELVLALPMLMAVMALMIVFGHTAYWKVRGLTVARNAAWSNRWPRAGFDEPAPRPFTPPQYSRRGAPNLEGLDVPELKHEVVRGPLPGGFNVNERLLNPARGMTEGHAEAKIEPAMMSTIPGFQNFKFNLSQSLLDDKFQYPQMGIPANRFRRIPFIYELPKADAAVSQGWVNAALAVMNAPFRGDLAPLDRDEEIFNHYGGYIDFHPRASRFCSLDLESAWNNQARSLIDRIKGRQRPRVSSLPERMTNVWIGMYQSQINGFQSRINGLQGQIASLQNQLQGLPPEATEQMAMLQQQIAEAQGEIAQNQAQIDAIRPQLDILLAFRQRLRNMPTPPDGPGPDLASVAAAQVPLRPIPAELMSLMSATETSCCGSESPVESLLRRLSDVDASDPLE